MTSSFRQLQLLTAGITALMLFTSCAYASQTTLAEAQQLFEKNNYEKAAVIVEKLLLEQPKPETLFLYANIQIQQAKYQSAIDTLNKLDQEHRNTPPALNNMAIAYANLGDYKKAISLLQAAIAGNPQFNQLYSNISQLFGVLATQAYAKALERTETPENNTSVTPQLKPFTRWDAPVNAPAPFPLEAKSQPIIEPPIKIDMSALKSDIRSTLEKWSASWSKQDVNSYLDFYDDEFQTPSDVSRRSWEAYRKDRLKEPGFIKVTAEDIRILLSEDGKLAVASFMQNYRSDTYKENSRKQLVLKQKAGQWRIYSEYSE